MIAERTSFVEGGVVSGGFGAMLACAQKTVQHDITATAVRSEIIFDL